MKLLIRLLSIAAALFCLPILAAAQNMLSNSPTVSTDTDILTLSGQLTQGGWMVGKIKGSTTSVFFNERQLTVDADGTFFVAFDRDAPGQANLQILLPEGTEIARQIQISRRDWNIERVNIARRGGATNEAFMARRAPELDAIRAAREISSGSKGWKQQFIWPTRGRISGLFGAQRIYRGEPGSYHSGLDIAPGDGAPFLAPADGTVVLAEENFSLEGKLLIIDHGQGLNSAFLHASRLYVKVGEEIKQGQHIGDVGSSGRATGPHLHWSIKWRDARLDPLLFLPNQN